jgi:hypothetical protein
VLKILSILSMFVSFNVLFMVSSSRPRAWYAHLSDKLHELAFVFSKADTSIFIFFIMVVS